MKTAKELKALIDSDKSRIDSDYKTLKGYVEKALESMERSGSRRSKISIVVQNKKPILTELKPMTAQKPRIREATQPAVERIIKELETSGFEVGVQRDIHGWFYIHFNIPLSVHGSEEE